MFCIHGRYFLTHCNMAVSQLRGLVAGCPPRRPGFEPRSGHVGFVMDKLALGQVFSEYFGFPWQFSFRLLHAHHISSGAGTIGQLVADVPSELSVTPPQETYKKKLHTLTRLDTVPNIRSGLLISSLASHCGGPEFPTRMPAILATSFRGFPRSLQATNTGTATYIRP
jgi:hypothetical protein